MSLFNIIVLSIIQGVTELFPVSSLGHTIIFQAVINSNVNQTNTNFLAFVVALHLGTSIALLTFFYQDWIKILKSLGKTALSGKIDNSSFFDKFAWFIVLGSIPVGIIALFFEKEFKTLFTSPILASSLLMVNGCILIGSEKLKSRVNIKQLKDITYPQSFLIGSSQIFALFPGISRSGISMASGLISKLNNKDAAYLSFMLATPIIFAAGLIEIPTLFSPGSIPFSYAVLGAVLSGITAYFSVKYLMKYFTNRNLIPYGYYCLALGFLFLIYFVK